MIIEAGCGVHSDGEGGGPAQRHPPLYPGKNAHVVYKGKAHYANSAGSGAKKIDRLPTQSWPKARAWKWTPCSWAA